MSRILISGGTGLIGSRLADLLIEKGNEIIILTRDKNRTSDHPKISYSFWNIKDKIIDVEAVRNSDHIIHLAGAGVMDKKWKRDYKHQIIDSRTKSADLLINCLRNKGHNVKTFVSASAIGWYGKDPKPLLRKEGFVENDPSSDDFLARTSFLCESASSAAAKLGIRQVRLRTGLVLSNNGGLFKRYLSTLRFGIAPILGNGKQVVSWIHIDDLCRMYFEAIENKEMNGEYNAVAPEPLTQKDLVMELAQTIRKRFFIPVYVPSFYLKWMFQKRSVEILKSATVSCKKIKATGFTFLFPSIESAISDLAANPQK